MISVPLSMVYRIAMVKMLVGKIVTSLKSERCDHVLLSSSCIKILILALVMFPSLSFDFRARCGPMHEQSCVSLCLSDSEV